LHYKKHHVNYFATNTLLSNKTRFSYQCNKGITNSSNRQTLTLIVATNGRGKQHNKVSSANPNSKHSLTLSLSTQHITRSVQQTLVTG